MIISDRQLKLAKAKMKRLEADAAKLGVQPFDLKGYATAWNMVRGATSGRIEVVVPYKNPLFFPKVTK